MFKKLKEKITEEVKSSPQRFAEFTQTVTDKLQNNTTPDDSFFSIGEEDAHNVSDNNQTANSQGFSSVALVSPNSFPRRNSNASIASDVSFLPRYESSNTYHLQSDLDVSASEIEDNVSTSSSTIGHLSKEQIYSAFQKSQMRYHKYRGRYTDLARHYKELERENGKMKSVLVETQDKAIRRVTELKEQCGLEQKAKAHLEGALRDEIDEKNYKINTLLTKIELLQSDGKSNHLINIEEESKLETLTKYLNDARKEIETLNEKIQELKANSIVFQSKEQEYKTKISNLEKELTVFSEREKENNLKLAQSKMELHNELLSKDAEISNLKRDNEMLKQNLTAIESDKGNGNSKLENLQIQNKKLIEKLESLTQRSSYLENEMLKLESFKFEIENLNEKLQYCKQQNEKLITEKETLEKQILNIRDDAKKGLLSLEPKIRKRLQEAYAEREEELKRDFEEKIEKLSYSNNDLTEIRLELFAKEDFISKITEEFELTKSELSRKADAYNELEKNHLDLIENCTQLRNTVSKLEKELSLHENSNDKIPRLEAHINTLQDEVKHAKDFVRKKESENVILTEENFKLQQILDEVNENCKLMEEKLAGKEIEVTENKMLELKLQKIEEENEALLTKIEDERKMFNEMLEKHKELDEKEDEILILKNTLKEYRDEIEYVKSLLKEEQEKNCVLEKNNLKYEQEISKLNERIRIFEEKEEAINLDKTEAGILLLKVQKLEEENKKILESFELERSTFVKELVSMKPKVENETTNDVDLSKIIEEIKKINESKEQELIDLAKENNILQQKLNNCQEKLRLLEEKVATTEVEKTESNILSLKVQQLEEEKDKLSTEFENERKMFNELLENNKTLQEKEALVEQLDNKLIELQKELHAVQKLFEEEKAININLQEEKLILEKSISKFEEKIRIFEERDTVLDVEKTECDLLQMKLQKLEEEKQNLLDSFEKERVLFNEKHALNEDQGREMKENLKGAESEIEKLLDSNNNYKNELKKKNEQINELVLKTSNLSETIQKQTDEFNNLLDRTKKLDDVLENNKKQNSEQLQEEIAKQTKLLNEVQTLKNELAAKNKQILEMDEKIERIEKLYLEQEKLCKIKSEEIEKLLKQIESSDKTANEEKEILEKKLENSYKIQEETASLNDKLKQLESTLREKNAQVEIIKQENNLLTEERNALHHDITNLRSEFDMLNMELNNLKAITAQAVDVNKKSSQLSAENQNLKSQIESAQTEISELNIRIQQMTSDNRNIMEESQSILSENEELKLRLEAVENEHLSHDTIKKELDKKIEVLEETLKQVRQELCEVQEQNIQLLKEKSAVNVNETDIIKVQQEFYDIKEKCDNLIVENKALKTEYSKLEEKCDDFSKIKQKLESQIRDLEEQYTELTHEKQLLQDEVQELKISPLNYSHNNQLSSKLDELNILKQDKLLSDAQNGNELYLREIDELRDKLSKYKSLDLTNKSSIQFYEHELDKLKNQNDKLNRKLDETLVTLNHCAELSSSTEIEYLKNVLYNYMLGKESLILARVIAAVCKFDPQQTETILQREQQKQTLLGQFGFI